MSLFQIVHLYVENAVQAALWQINCVLGVDVSFEM